MTQPISVTLPAHLTLKEKDCVKFWNESCKEIQSALWLPHKIESQDPGSDLLKDSLNYQEDQLNFLMKKITPTVKKNLIQQNSWHSLPASVTVITERDPLNVKRKTIASRKIRVYLDKPEDRKKLDSLIDLGRRAHNLAVDILTNPNKNRLSLHEYITKKIKLLSEKQQAENEKAIKEKRCARKLSTNDINISPYVDIRAVVIKICKEEQSLSGNPYLHDVVANAVLRAKKTFFKCIKEGTQIQFRSRKDAKQSIFFDRFPKSCKPLKSVISNMFITESLFKRKEKDEPYYGFIGKSYTITRNRNRYYINIKQEVELATEIQGIAKCIALDPGVRTFLTGFSENEH